MKYLFLLYGKPLPEPGGSWQHAALQAKRLTIRLVIFAATAALLLAVALAVDLWDHTGHLKQYSPDLWLTFAIMPAYFTFLLWWSRKRSIKLDRAAHATAGLAGAGNPATDQTAP